MITTDEVINQATVDTVETKTLLNSIVIAEERFIKPAICPRLYYDFRQQKNVEVTALNKTFLQSLVDDSESGELVLELGQTLNAIELVANPYYVELWNEHLWKILAEAVVYIATPANYTRYTASGIMEHNPKVISNEGQNSATIDLKKMQWHMDKLLMDRIDPLLSAMSDWLENNRSFFAHYDCMRHHSHDSNLVGTEVNRKSAWISVYGKPYTEPCCG